MSDKVIAIRCATPADLDTVTRFNVALADESEGKRLDPAIVREGVRAALADPHRAAYYLAELDRAVAGQTMITLEWSDWRNGYFWWIQSVYVEPFARRRGVFRALHHHIRDEARARLDVCGLRLYVHRDNTLALETYRRLNMPACDYLLCEESWSKP